MLVSKRKAKKYYTFKRPKVWVWTPTQVDWWVSLGFMIGSTLFALGSLLTLLVFSNVFLINLLYFIGSIFFTSSGYIQYHQAINDIPGDGQFVRLEERSWFAMRPKELLFWSALTQFIGTILFNFNTFDAFLNLGWFWQDMLIWLPDIAGSVLFQISGIFALLEIGRRLQPWQMFGVEHWITLINFAGCVAFLISACLAFVTANAAEIRFWWSTLFTLLGAIAFFVAAYLVYLGCEKNSIANYK